jgi:O-antigen/teichoic acid export membrane protein
VLPILIIFASNVAIQLYVNSDTVMLGFMKNDYVVGIYSAAAKINNIVNTTLIAAITVSIPRLSMLMGTGKLREYYRLLKQVISIIFIIYLPAVLGLFMESKDIIQIISGSNYLRAVTSLRILCFLLIFSAISSTIIQCILIPTKQEIKSLNCTMLGAIINIGLNFVLIPLFSEKGAAVTSVIADFVTFILSFYYGRNILINVFRDKQVKKNITQAAVASSCIVLICLICHSYVANVPLRLLLSAICSIFAYLSILVLLKNNMINEVISQIKS